MERWRALAQRQHGVLSLAQLTQCGLTDDAVWRRAQAGELGCVLPGVYRVVGATQTWLQALMAVCLWGGEGTVASHRSAAALWGLEGFEEGPLEVSTLKKNQSDAHFKTHRRAVDPRVSTRRHGIPVTNATSTIVDLSAVLSESRLGHVVDDACRQGLTSLQALGKAVRQAPVRGTAKLHRVLARRDPAKGPSASELQREVREFLIEAGLEGFEEEGVILDAAGRFLARGDFVFRDRRVVVEAESVRHHAGTEDFYEDLNRRNRLTAALWAVLHVTWVDLTERRAKRAREIWGALSG